MVRRVNIVFCGLVRDPGLLNFALSAAIGLRNRGRVHRLIISTWLGEVEKIPDGRDYLASIGVELVESEMPAALERPGNVFQQMLVMDRALDTIDDDALVMRTRTDVAFLDEPSLDAVISQDLTLGRQLVEEPAPLFSRRIWTPYFHPLFPFYFADQVYFGAAQDLRKLNNYDMLVEAYRVGSRPHEVWPSHSSGAAAEIRRFLSPFAQRFPLLREYQFVWPKHCIGTSLLTEVLAFNMQSEIYLEYLALSLAMTYRYFNVGGLLATFGKLLVLGIDDDKAVQVRMSLAQQDPLPRLLAERLRVPQPGTRLFSPNWCSAWLDDLFGDPGGDPDASALVLQPLARAARYRSDARRRAAYGAYRAGLCVIADRCL